MTEQSIVVPLAKFNLQNLLPLYPPPSRSQYLLPSPLPPTYYDDGAPWSPLPIHIWVTTEGTWESPGFFPLKEGDHKVRAHLFCRMCALEPVNSSLLSPLFLLRLHFFQNEQGQQEKERKRSKYEPKSERTSKIKRPRGIFNCEKSEGDIENRVKARDLLSPSASWSDYV